MRGMTPQANTRVWMGDKTGHVFASCEAQFTVRAEPDPYHRQAVNLLLMSIFTT
jgi:hypothetical protein